MVSLQQNMFSDFSGNAHLPFWAYSWTSSIWWARSQASSKEGMHEERTTRGRMTRVAKICQSHFFRKTFEIELWYWIMIYVAFFTAKVQVSIGRIVSEEFRKKGMTRNAFIFKGAGQKCFGRMLNTIEGCRLNPLRNNLQKSLVCLAWVSRFASSFQTKLRWSWWSDNRFYPIHVDNLSHCKKMRKKMEKKTETTFWERITVGKNWGRNMFCS